MMPAVPNEWSKSLEREFASLADKAIAGNLAPVEKPRFNELSALRRRLHHPRTVKEILYEQERTELLIDLSNAVARCVKFLDGSGQNFTRAAT